MSVTKTYMKSILLLLGADDNEDLDNAIDEIYAIETSLAEVGTLHTIDNIYV